MTTRPAPEVEVGSAEAYDLLGHGWDRGPFTYTRARKRFLNFLCPPPTLVEAPAGESLDVLIRRPRNGATDVPDSAASAFERETVLTLPDTPWFLDLVDLVHPSTLPAEGRVWLVLSDPHVGPTAAGAPTPLGSLVRVLTEVPAMLHRLAEAGLGVDELRPGDFVVDPEGGWFFLATERVRPRGPEHDLGRTWARLAAGWLGIEAEAPAGKVWPAAAGLTGSDRRMAEGLLGRVHEALGA